MLNHDKILDEITNAYNKYDILHQRSFKMPVFIISNNIINA